jgi:tRNA(fMet)-specific endonuclease VapC
MLDTNIISALMRDSVGTLWRKARRFGGENICTSVIVAGELRFGAELADSARLRSETRDILATIPVLAFEPPADEHYARLRSRLRREGRPIGPNDLFIAAHALSLGLILVTANVGGFSRVPGLVVENWLD